MCPADNAFYPWELRYCANVRIHSQARIQLKKFTAQTLTASYAVSNLVKNMVINYKKICPNSKIHRTHCGILNNHWRWVCAAKQNDKGTTIHLHPIPHPKTCTRPHPIPTAFIYSPSHTCITHSHPLTISVIYTSQLQSMDRQQVVHSICTQYYLLPVSRVHGHTFRKKDYIASRINEAVTAIVVLPYSMSLFLQYYHMNHYRAFFRTLLSTTAVITTAIITTSLSTAMRNMHQLQQPGE